MMDNSRLINILRTFSKGEIKEFEKWISSSFFNKGRNYLPFFKELKKFYPRFDNAKMTPEYVFKKMYPGKKFNKQIMWNMNSALLNMAEEFLIYVSLSKNKFIREYRVAEEFLERKLSDYHSKKVNDMEKALEKMGFSHNYFRYKTQLESARIAYHYLEDTQHLLFDHVIKKGEYVILNFLKDISDVIAGIEASANMYNKELETNIPFQFVKDLQLEKIIEYSNKNNFRYGNVLQMYYLSIKMILEFENEEHFFKLRKLFEQNYNQFSQEEKYGWIVELTNYCVQKINTGNREFRKTIFEIDKFKLKEGIVFPKRYMSKTMFLQILGNALAVNEIEWGKDYVEKYLHKLKPSYQKPMQAFSYAYINFRLKNYDKVLENLGKVRFIDVIDKVYVKSLYIRTYFNLDETEILLNQIDSMRHFLNKNKLLGDYFRKTYTKSLNCINRLIIAKEKKDYFEIEKLENTIKSDNTIQLGEWMLEKIAEIKKGAV